MMYPFHNSSHNHRILYHRLYLCDRELALRGLMVLFWLCFGMLLTSCDLKENGGKKRATRGEYISRLHEEHFIIPSTEKKDLEDYPWKKKLVGGYPKIT